MFLSAVRSRLLHVFLVTVVTIVLSAALFFSIHTTSQAAATNLALNRPVVASSVFRPVVDKAYVNDGNLSTRWSSQYSDPQWIYVDLGARYALQSVVLKWENAYGKAYSIQVSNDASNWTTVYSTTVGDGATDTIALNTTGRYVRMYGTKRATSYGYSIYEFEVYGTSIVTVPVPTISLSAASALITEGQSTTLTWTSTKATSCTGTNFTTGGATSGSVTMSPMATTTYGIACTGAGGTTSASTIVGVKLLPAIAATCSATPTAVYTGTVVTWTVSASGGNGTYTYNWNGTDSLAGTAATISKIYTTAGAKTAQVSILSGTKNATVTCTNTVQVTEPDRQPPAVVVTAPVNGATVSGSIAVSGTSSDNVGVVGVKFFLDGATLLQDEKILPYSFRWNTLTTPDGSHTIMGVARDAAGNNATSASVTFTVRNAPTATLTVASATITEDESTTLTWSSARATTCAGVGFTTGGATSGTVTVSPTATTTYTVTCTGPGGTTNASVIVGVTLLPPITATCTANVATAYTGDTVTWTAVAAGGNGSYRYTWTGTDGISGTTNPLPVTYALAGDKTAQVVIQSGTKSVIIPCASTVMVREPDRQVPSVNIVSPFSAASLAGSVLITADASDNVGVVGVQYLLDGANLDTEKTITPYGLLWNTLLTSDGTHTLAAIARDAAGNNATSEPVTITVGNIPVVTFTTDTSLIVEGQSAVLSWTATNAQSCVGVGFTTNNATSGSVTVSPTATTTYSIACTGAGGTTSAAATINVTLLPPITATCTANVATAYTGDTVTWSVLASGGMGAYTYVWSGTDGLSGSTSAVSMVYTTSGTKTAQVTIVSGTKSATVTCSNSVEVNVPLKFDIADRVLVSTDTTLNVRDSANGTVIGQQVNGAGGIVVDGPVYAGSLRWWNIDYDNGVDGWSVEDFLVSDMPPRDQLPTTPDIPDASI